MVELVMMRNAALDGVRPICFHPRSFPLIFFQVEGRGLVENYKEADVASYYEIWRQVVKLADTCLLNFGIPGLITTGKCYREISPICS